MAAIGDEVEDEAELAQLFGETLHLVVGHARGIPVERGRKIVGEHFIRENGVNRFGKLACFGEIRLCWSPSREYPQTERPRGTSRSRNRFRPGPDNSRREFLQVRDPTRHQCRAMRALARADGPRGALGESEPIVDRHIEGFAVRLCGTGWRPQWPGRTF